MKKAEPNEQLGTSTLGFVFANIAHLRRFMHPETKLQALYGHSFVGGIGLAGFGGYALSASVLFSIDEIRKASTYATPHFLLHMFPCLLVTCPGCVEGSSRPSANHHYLPGIRK